MTARILLNVPEQVINANIATLEEVKKLFVEKKWDELDLFTATTSGTGQAISLFGDDFWDLSAYVDSRIICKTKMYFSEIDSYPLAVEFKYITFAWLYGAGHSRASGVIKPSTLITRHTNLKQTYKYLNLIGAKSIYVLQNPIYFFEYCEHLKNEGRGFGSTNQILSALFGITILQDYLPEPFEVPIDTSMAKISEDICDPKKLSPSQYFAIPSKIMQNIYKFAINQIEMFLPFKEEIHSILEDIRRNHEIGKRIVDSKIESGRWQWIENHPGNYRVEVNKARPKKIDEIVHSHITGTELEAYVPTSPISFQGFQTRLQVCCYLICGGFTGMRRSELYGLHSDSYIKYDIQGQTFHTLQSYHSKMLSGRARKAEWVTAPIAKSAIELAEALSRNMRSQLMESNDGMDNELAPCLWLTQYRKNNKPKVLIEGVVARHLSNIVAEANAIVSEEDIEEFNLINPNKGTSNGTHKIKVGQPWPISTHQFRRTFAVFGKRHNLLSDVALKKQYKHLTLQMTLWYEEGGIASRINDIFADSDLGKLIEQVGNEVTIQKLHGWYNSDEKLFGKKGKQITKERSYTPTRYSTWESIQEQVDKGRMQLVSTLHSYCMAGYECRMSSAVTPFNCFSCENVVIDKLNAELWKKRHEWISKLVLELGLNLESNSSKLNHYTCQLDAAEQVMEYFKIPYTPYKESLSIKENE